MLFRGLLFLNIKVTKNKIIKKRDYYFDYYKRIFFDFLNQKVGCCVFTQKMSSNIHLIKKNQKVGCCVFTQKMNSDIHLIKKNQKVGCCVFTQK